MKENGIFFRLSVKRAFDCGAAAILLTVACPVMLLIAALILWRLGRPILFRQVRAGRGGAPFTILKFRTMADRRDGAGRLLGDGQRLTRLGIFLRRWSLDELPQLWNVFRGDMSLVGPRPLLMEYLGHYTPEQARRHEVRPGITGWAQVHGRNAISWEEKFALDAWYVRHAGLALDLRILMLTPLRVLRREGISAASHATMPPFSTAKPEERKCA